MSSAHVFVTFEYACRQLHLYAWIYSECPKSMLAMRSRHIQALEWHNGLFSLPKSIGSCFRGQYHMSMLEGVQEKVRVGYPTAMSDSNKYNSALTSNTRFHDPNRHEPSYQFFR